MQVYVRCLAAIYFSVVIRYYYDETYGVIYEVIQGKFRASLEPLWAMEIARYVE